MKYNEKGRIIWRHCTTDQKDKTVT